MKRIGRKRQILIALAGLVLLVAGYYVVVLVRAYVAAPGIVASALASGRMALVPAEFPAGYLDELLAVEDPAFYSHHGVDLSTPGAGMTTITQALVKRFFFAPFKPGIAKIKQSLIALIFDRRVDKRTQLLLFVNSVYMGTVAGREVIGLNDAALVYFGKPFTQISHDEYLALVAMAVGPDSFSVLEHPDRNAERVRRIKKLLAGECRPSGNSDVYYENCAR